MPQRLRPPVFVRLLVASAVTPWCGAGQTAAADSAPRPRDAAGIEWLRQHALPIRTIDPADDDFSDLLPLKRIIGDARVVGLSEQSHGDGATFYAKERLVRFLHAQMGFDVLAWESGS